MNHLIEEKMTEKDLKDWNFIVENYYEKDNAKELTIKLLKDQMDILSQYISDLRVLKEKLTKNEDKQIHQGYINIATDEYLDCEEDLNRLQSDE